MQLKRFTTVLLSLILIWTKTYAEISGSQIYDDSVYRQLLVIWDDVNYRTEPAGTVINHLDSGETLLWIGELRTEDELWYHTVSEVHGEGYIMAKYATPIMCSESIKSDSPLDDNLLDFYKEYYSLQIKYGFLIPDEANASFVYSWDEALD